MKYIKLWQFKQFIYKLFFGFISWWLFPLIRLFTKNKLSAKDKMLLEIKKELDDLYGTK